MKKRLLKLTVLLLLTTISGFAQERTVSGTVSGKDGSAMPGVNVIVKGTSTGTTTNADGLYKVSVPSEQSILIFSFIGHATQEITVGNRTSLDIVLAEDATQLGEVVVTALGIEKDVRSLGYSLTKVDGSNFTQAREVNVANSLVGRVAGVSVSGVAGGPGSSSNVQIRGVSSLSGSSPLYVINGVPIDNTQRGGSGQWGGADMGDGIGNLNPDDIESMTVLKGSTAAALYGSRAIGGVIVITTKSGKGRKGLGVEYNSNLVADRVIDYRDFQYVYGEGVNGVKPTTQVEASATGASWGAKLDGSSVIQSDGVSRPYVAQSNNYKNFYKTGSTFTNTISLGNSTDKGSYRFSASNLGNNSVVPTSGLSRNSFNLNVNYKIAPKLTFDLVTNYVIEKGKKRPNLSDSPGNANFGVSFLPTSYDVRTLAPGYDALGKEKLVSAGNIYYTNPYFAANKFINNTNRNRIINVVKLKYDLTSWLMLQGRVANDAAFDRVTAITPIGTAYRAAGDISEQSIRSAETNADFLLSANKEIVNDFTVVANIGGNLRKNKYEVINSAASTFSVPVETINNATTNKSIGYQNRNAEVHSFYYSADFSYKSFLTLSTTGRQDKFSYLDGRSIFYPSAGLSFIFSDLLKMPGLSFGKLRGSWAKSTSDPFVGLYQSNLYYGFSGSANGFPLGQITNSNVPNRNLLPNKLKEFEAGLDLRFFEGRIGLDVAYFNRKSTGEPLNVTTSITSGYSGATLNVGSVESKGIELLLTATPVKTNNFSWNMSFNYTNNNNRVVSLTPELTAIQSAVSRSLNAFIRQIPGERVSQVSAFDFKRDASGSIIYDANGKPMQGDLKNYGTSAAPIYGGLNNELKYKSFNLSFLIDYKFGNKLFSATNYYAYIYGLHKNTLVGREEGVVGVGVNEAGQPNNVKVSAQDYYGGNGDGVAQRISSQFVYNAGFVKLRQVTLGYTLPTRILGKLPIQSVTVSLVARNLLILKKWTPNIDPESSYSNSPLTAGLELAGVPPMRSYGFNLNIKL
jgi:TonB-linked SusC/RagA family outer membrane protein